MYQPAHFREERLEVQHQLIQAHPLGLVVTAGPSGLMANPIPAVLDADSAGTPRLRLHLARANAQWKELAVVTECLIVFQGPQEYITPSWLATKRETGKVVPTWNYATVHVWGRPRIVEDPAWLLAQIGGLTHLQESGKPAPWAVGDAPPDFVATQLKAIVGVEIEILRTEGKWKVSQNRNEADRAGIVAGLRNQGSAAEAMADLVARYGAPPAS